MANRIPDEQILDAAVAVFAAHGFAGATTRQIAAAAGINEVTLFRRFGSKRELLREAIQREMDAFADAGGARPTGDVRTDLQRVVRLYQELNARRRGLLPVILVELPRDESLGGLVTETLRVVQSIAGLIDHYQAKGELRAEPSLPAAIALLAPLLVSSLMRQSPTSPQQVDEPDPREYVARYLDGRRRRGKG